MRLVVLGAMILVSAPAMAEAPHLLRGPAGQVIGVTDIGSKCSPEDHGACVPFQRTGVIKAIVRNKRGVATSLTLQTNGFYSSFAHIYPIDMALGDAAMDLADPLPAPISKSLSAWLRPGKRIVVVGTMSGADGGMIIATAVWDAQPLP
jgi:hypothetical protein